VQEINRKGRVSPLPQAVQGAQAQLPGPAGEPGIKSEFGRMFSGIGTGVGTISSPVPSGAQPAYGGAGLLRRDDMDCSSDAPADLAKATGRGKRRKLKEEEEEGNNGRLTPVGGRAKKPKGHHHHQYVVPLACRICESNKFGSHHHHHHHHNLDQVPSPALAGNTPFRNVKGSTPVPSPTALAKELPGGHHHHHHHHHANPRSQPNTRPAPAPRSPSPVILPKPKQFVSSKAVLDSVADRPRTHLGDAVYEPTLKRARLQDPRTGRPPRSGYKSTPKPLPWDLIEGKENCTLTVKIGKEHLVPAAREEITSRRALWGTDVYTDDSDVVAACIHAGWIRGAWPEDVDVSMLGLDEGYSVSDVRGLLNGSGTDGKGSKASSQQSNSGSLTVLTEPPKTGPMPVPENRDLHVTLLILPRLERYASTTRFGIKSREFGGPVGSEEAQQRAVHDGISFMVLGLRWVTNGGASQSRLRGKARRERIRKALEEVAMTPAWISRPVNGVVTDNGVEVEREVGLGWWKQNTSKPPSEGDKENMNRAVDSQVRETAPKDTHKDAQQDDRDIQEAHVENEAAEEEGSTKDDQAKQAKDDIPGKENAGEAKEADTELADNAATTPETGKQVEDVPNTDDVVEEEAEPKEPVVENEEMRQNKEEQEDQGGEKQAVQETQPQGDEAMKA